MNELEPIASERLVLVPVAARTAAAVIAGDLSDIDAGAGWPHADTLDGLRMIPRGGSAWFVTLDGLVIGDCGVHGAPDAAGDVEIGYGLAEPHRGHGYASEFVAALVGWLLRQPDVARVVARDVDRDNIPSRRALERAGFTLERECSGTVDYAVGR